VDGTKERKGNIKGEWKRRRKGVEEGGA